MLIRRAAAPREFSLTRPSFWLWLRKSARRLTPRSLDDGLGDRRAVLPEDIASFDVEHAHEQEVLHATLARLALVRVIYAPGHEITHANLVAEPRHRRGVERIRLLL